MLTSQKKSSIFSSGHGTNCIFDWSIKQSILELTPLLLLYFLGSFWALTLISGSGRAACRTWRCHIIAPCRFTTEASRQDRQVFSGWCWCRGACIQLAECCRGSFVLPVVARCRKFCPLGNAHKKSVWYCRALVSGWMVLGHHFETRRGRVFRWIVALRSECFWLQVYLVGCARTQVTTARFDFCCGFLLLFLS